MVRRWTLASIIITISIIVTVSAFRVRLAHERSQSQKQCDSCDVNELNLDQKHRKLSDKRAYDGLKKVVQERLKAEGKLSADDLTYLHGLSGSEKYNVKVKPKISTNDNEHFVKKPEKVIKSSGKLIPKTENIKNKNDDSDDDIAPKILNDDDNDESDDEKINDSDDDDIVDVDTDNENDNSDDDNSVVDDVDDSDSENGSNHDEKESNDRFQNGGADISDDENEDDEEDDRTGAIQKSLKILTKSEKKLPEQPQLKKSAKVNEKDKVSSPAPKKVVTDDKVDNKLLKKSNDPVVEKIKVDIKKETKVSKIKSDEIKKEAPKITEKDELEKIKVKSHIEGGKLQSQIIPKDEESHSKLNEKKVLTESKKSLEDSKEVKTKPKITSKIKTTSDVSHKRILLQSEFEDFYGFFPSFAPNFSRVHNPECRRHGQILLRQLRGTKLWALNMLDATAKIPSGLLQGNGIQLGDFDQCLSTRARVQLETGSIVKVQGKYCLVTMDVKAEHPDLEVPVDLLQGRNIIKGRINDPGHFVPRFSTLSWGLCVPSPCGPDDVEAIIKDTTKHYGKLGITLDVEVDELDCQVLKKGSWWEDWLEIPTILTLCFYGVILALVIIATCQDLFGERNSENETPSDGEKADDGGSEKRSEGFISAFSLPRTMKKLSAPAGAEEIPSIHGLRALAALALIVPHKFFPVAHMPYTNRIKVAEMVSSPTWSVWRVGWVYTDCFLLLSGSLTSYRTSENTSAFSKLASKYLRLTPALLAVVWFYAYVWEHIATGPMWGSLVVKNAEICRDSWWWNLVYLQNYFGLENMCAPQTHQLALDMQLSLVGSFIVWAIHSNIVGSGLAIPLIHIVAAYSRYTNFRDHRLTMIAYHGVSVSQLYRTGRMSYTSILHRSTSYLIGISLGLALRSRAQHRKLLAVIGWVTSAGLYGGVLWAGWDSGSLTYQYNATFAAQYAALAPIATALAFAWLVYAAHNGYSDMLSSFLCCRPLLIISRISYALYLTQFIVFITNAGTVKTSSEFTLISLIDIKEITAIFALATILTLTLVIPMQSLPSMLFGKARKQENEEVESQEETKTESAEAEKEEQPSIQKPLLAHRELLEEIPENEVEYEIQRDNPSLEEITEEDDNIEDERLDEEDLEIIEEEEEVEEEEREGGEDFWAEQESRRDLDEWEWANGKRGGAQYYRYGR